MNTSNVIYGDYSNSGPGANSTNHCPWCQQLPLRNIENYTLDNVIKGSSWLPATGMIPIQTHFDMWELKITAYLYRFWGSASRACTLIWNLGWRFWPTIWYHASFGFQFDTSVLNLFVTLQFLVLKTMISSSAHGKSKNINLTIDQQDFSKDLDSLCKLIR